jgi:ParB-like chromosome segregation protein Spo0J
MSITINTLTKTTRTDLYNVNPFEIEINNDLRGRHIPPTDQQIIQRAYSMLPPSMGGIGQIQPIEARRKQDKTLLITLGFTRINAARRIRQGFTYNGTHYQDPNYTIQVRVIDCDDPTALKRNIAENAQRNPTSPIDDAYNQIKLATECGMTDQEIANFYNTTSTKIKTLRKLLQHTPAIQHQIHTGEISVTAALTLLELPEEEREQAIQNAKRNTGTINGAKIQTQIRNKILSRKCDHDNPTPVKTKTRTHKEIKTYLQILQDPTQHPDPNIRQIAKALTNYITGKTGDQALTNAIYKLYNLTPNKEEDVA